VQPLTKHDPRTIGPYRLTGRLGTGGMGTVYAARDAHGTDLAVKVVHDEYSGERDFRTRFAREVDLMRRVHSPLLPRFHDADTAVARPWLATELLAGNTLAGHVRRHGPLTGGRLFAFAAAAAEALRVIHGCGIVHRDLKPGNVILADRRPVLLDFGIARAAEQTAMTRTGLVLGTPGWVSPEQFQGHPADARSDMFAWGALLAYAAAGRAPFTDPGAGGPAHQAGTGVPDLQAVPPGL
jgi:eukaryotic-like serine/threonine-protein kinase